MAKWYRHDIASWMDGTEDLDDQQYRVYHVVCQLIYLNEGPIRVHEKGIAGRCNMHMLTFRAVLAKLVSLEKLSIDGGRLFNGRAMRELKRLPPNKNLARTSHQPPTNLPPTSPEPTINGGEGHDDKSLNNNTSSSQEPLQTRLDKTRPKKDGADAPQLALVPDSQEAPDARVYRRGREVLGKSSGGVVTKLIRAKHGNLNLAMAALEQASTKHKPSEYIGGVIRGASDDSRMDPVEYRPL